MVFFIKSSFNDNIFEPDWLYVKLIFLAWRTSSAWSPSCTVQKRCSWGEVKIYLSQNNYKLNMYFFKIEGKYLIILLSKGLRPCTPAWPVLCLTTTKTQIDHRRSKMTGHLPTELRFGVDHSFMVFIIIPMVFQVDRSRRKEVAVKVREGKHYRFRDEVRSEQSWHGRIMRDF